MTMLKFTTADCKKLLPGVLADYLWRLAGESGEGAQAFLLSAKYTGTGDVQDILHRRGNFSSWHRVFGYAPVNATVEVRFTELGAIMSLVKNAPARAQKEEAQCSA